MTTERVSFFKDLIIRRVPQIMGGYLAASWIIIEFIDWLVKRYPLSPHLVEFAMVAMASMIPTVLLLAYYHGKPGPDKWVRIEKIGIPTNLVIAVAILFFVFNGRELGATTTTVTLMNEQGQQVERLIPKSEFRKKVAMFSMENESGDQSIDWLMHAFPNMLQYDLSQDIYVDIKSTYDFYDKIQEAGFPDAINIPMTLKKKIAGELYMEYFTSGTINVQDNQYSIQISLYNTKTAKLLKENLFSGEDLFILVDEINVWLKDELEIPLQHIENTEDLPVSEILTNSIPALTNFFNGYNAVAFENNWAKGLGLLEQSIREDETFAFAYLNLYLFYALTSQGQKYMQTFQPLMQHLYKLPERLQFAVKHDYYYGIKQEPEMALDVAKNWVELYPADLKAHNVLAILYMIRNQKDNELAEYKKILSLDPGQYDLLLKIGEIYADVGEFDEALKYYQQYLNEFPNNIKSFLEIGNLYSLSGDYEQAKSNYKKALLIEPDNISVLLLLADIESELGHFSQALEEYNKIMESCEGPEDRYHVFKSMEDYYYMRGQIDKSVETMDLKFAEMEQIAPPYVILNKKFESLGKYIKAGKSDYAFQLIKTAEEQLGPPLDQIIPFGYLDIYLEQEDIQNAEKYLSEAEAIIQASHAEANRTIILNAQGRIHELKGEHEQAIESYSKQLALEPTNSSIHFLLGRCYRKTTDLKKAEEHIKMALAVHPFQPKANYEMALLYFDTGKDEDALEHLKRALNTWENADPDYEPAINAREKLAEMEDSAN